VATASLDRSDSGKLRAGRILDGLASCVPVKVPLKERIVGGVDFSSLLSGGDRSTIITTLDGDVEGLGPELPL
jgi:hypothetical protein